jgi:hypothetical protein
MFIFQLIFSISVVKFSKRNLFVVIFKTKKVDFFIFTHHITCMFRVKKRQTNEKFNI